MATNEHRDNQVFTKRQAIESLRSETCPACGKAKKAKQSLCYPCYKRLPQDRQHDLYNRIGEGYEEALGHAMTLLGVEVPTMPTDRRDEP